MPGREVHGILGMLDRQRRTTHDLTSRQEWLWDCLVSELEWRHLHEPRILRRCWCEWCIPQRELPFDQEESSSSPEEPF